MKLNYSSRWLSALIMVALFFSVSSRVNAGFLWPHEIAPPDGATDFSAWDDFYNPYNGANYPDLAAPFGTRQTASSAGFTVPPGSTPANPTAYFDVRNPTITQVGTSSAFIIGPGTTGNIYSFAAPTAYQVTDTVASPLGLVLYQMQTDGSTVDFSSIKLQYTNSSGTLAYITPTQYVTEYQSDTTSGFGFAVTNRTALEWNLIGLNITSFTIDYSSLTSSMSMQLATLDTASTYTSYVPQARTWIAAGSGVWSTGANWSGGSSSVENGNVFFSPTASATVALDASHTVGQIGFQSASNVTINSSGGAVLTSNTGIMTTATATGTYVINANYATGDYNVFDIAAGTVQLNGTVSGTSAFFKQGEGRLELHGNNTFAGGVGVQGGVLEMSGTNTYAGGTTVVWGKLIVASDSLNGVAGALGSDTSTLSIGTDSTFYTSAPEAAALFIDGDHTLGRNIQLTVGAFEKDLGAQNTSSGATFTGAIALNMASNVHLQAASAGDKVTFSGGITGGVASSSTASQVIIDGLGTVILGGTNNTYLNDTVVSSGILRVANAGSLTSSGKVTVAAGAKLSVDGTLAGSGNLGLHGTLSGTGTVSRAFTVDSTSVLNAGEGVGTLTTVAETWASGGSLQFNLANATGTAGSGWNFLQINGSLSITASDVFHIDLASLGVTNQPGLALDFDPSQDRTWKIADATGGITGFNASVFQLNEDAFENAYGGVFTVTQSANDIFLSYTAVAVPEPSTYFLLLLGVGVMVALRRRVRLP